MSTYIYLVCRDHSPAVQADSIDVIVIGDHLESLSEAMRSVWTWLEPQPSLPKVRTWPAYRGTNLRVEGTDEQAVRETFAAELARLREAS